MNVNAQYKAFSKNAKSFGLVNHHWIFKSKPKNSLNQLLGCLVIAHKFQCQVNHTIAFFFAMRWDLIKGNNYLEVEYTLARILTFKLCESLKQIFDNQIKPLQCKLIHY